MTKRPHNKVDGRVVTEVGVGIPNLVITLLDVDSPDEEGLRAAVGSVAAPTFRGLASSQRMGTTVSDSSGGFSFTFLDDDFGKEVDKRPDLLLVVSSPALGTAAPRLLHAADIRWTAGRDESYLVKLTKDQLAAAGVEPPVVGDSRADSVLSAIRRDAENTSRLAAGLQGVRRVHTDAALQLRAALRPTLKQVAREIALAPSSADERAGERFVDSSESVFELNRAAVVDGLRAVNDNGRAGIITLTEQQVTDLETRFPGLVGIPSADFDILLHSNDSNTGSALLLRDNPLSVECLDQSSLANVCADAESASSESSETGSNADEDVERPPVTVASAVAAILGSIVPSQPAAGSGDRATAGSIDRNVRDFQVPAGPADAPAVHDFHQLDIAFEHVWQAAVDEDVLDDAMKVYREVVLLQGEPVEIPSGKEFLSELRFQATALISVLSGAEPPVSVMSAFEVTPQQWRVLNAEQRQGLIDLSSETTTSASVGPINVSLSGITSTQREKATRILGYADAKLADEELRLHSLDRNLTALQARLREPYRFTYYGADSRERSVNFGQVVTYRQRWVPGPYQAGEMVKTIPLAPGEVRKYSYKQTVKRSRRESESIQSSDSRRRESSETQRDVAEIIQNAQTTTSFSTSAQGSFNFVLKDATLNTAFGKEAKKASRETKRRFREAVKRSAEEYKRDRKLEIVASDEETIETTETGEITNPNRELTVTYLFYELQRRYMVSEQIHKLTPVVLVAQEMPSPHEIDEDWLLGNAWMIRRVLLDDVFLAALDALPAMGANELALRQQKLHLDKQTELVSELKEQLVLLRRTRVSRLTDFEEAVARRASAIASDTGSGFLADVAGFLLGDGGPSPEAARVRQDFAEAQFERASREAADLKARLEGELTAYEALRKEYDQSLRLHLLNKTTAQQLRVHVKENILYYMQALWDFEDGDRRFFRLHKVKVPDLDAPRTYQLSRPEVKRLPMAPNWGHAVFDFEMTTSFEPEIKYRNLAEVADLDTLLGYKGNYMIFPLKHSNALTRYMSAPYVDAAAGLRDPDPFGNFTPAQLREYVCCLKQNTSEEDFEALIPEIEELYRSLLTSPRPAEEEIVVPTGSLFIEALPGSHALIEDFQLRHRAIDVQAAESKARWNELENVRLAARLLANELDDPNFDKNVRIEGVVTPSTDVTED